jgi:acyl-coenzyme A synthetase/AMP-(fatty) acid ligase
MAVCAELYGRQVVSLAKDDISYSVAKIPFAYGLGNTLYMPMAVGAAAVLSDASDTFRIIADVNKYRPTVFWGIPSVYANILALADVTLFDHAPIRLCVSAAEQLPKNIWVRFRERFGLEICEGIGTTEMLHIFLSNRPDGCHPGSSGWAVPGYTCRVIGLDGRQLDVGEIGELEVEGESLMLGYWNRYGETRSAIYGSAMRTGDLYRVDDEGLFYFVGRRDNIFKASGLWISPTEIEDVILRHGAVLACAVTHEHHPETDLPIVIAWLVLKPGYTPTKGLAADIRRRARGLVARYKVPKEIRFIEALPRTPTGKIDRSRLILPTTKQG